MGRRTAIKKVASLSSRQINADSAKAIAGALKKKFPELKTVQLPPNQSPNDELLFLLANFVAIRAANQNLITKQDIKAVASIFAKHAQTDISEDIVDALQYHATFGCLNPPPRKPKTKKIGHEEAADKEQQQQQQQTVPVTKHESAYGVVPEQPFANDEPGIAAVTIEQQQQQQQQQQLAKAAAPPEPTPLPVPERFVPSTYLEDVLGQSKNWKMFSSLEVLADGGEKVEAEEIASSSSCDDSDSNSEEVMPENDEAKVEGKTATEQPPAKTIFDDLGFNTNIENTPRENHQNNNLQTESGDEEVNQSGSVEARISLIDFGEETAVTDDRVIEQAHQDALKQEMVKITTDNRDSNSLSTTTSSSTTDDESSSTDSETGPSDQVEASYSRDNEEQQQQIVGQKTQNESNNN